MLREAMIFAEVNRKVMIVQSNDKWRRRRQIMLENTEEAFVIREPNGYYLKLQSVKRDAINVMHGLTLVACCTGPC